jgi:hypothetical protein
MDISLQQLKLIMTMKLFENAEDAMLDHKKIETCGLIKGLDFSYGIILCLSILLLFL